MGAKTGAVNEYTNYPEIEKRVNKATGGPNGKMPFFFQNSKNGRRDITTHRKKKREWAKPNNSTMNRICKAFDDIGNININVTDVPAFNWQMLLSEPCKTSRKDIANDFCSMDNIRISIAINNAEENPTERDITDNNSIIDEYITYTLNEKYGSLEYCYPYIVKHLFAAEGATKPSHKQTFWRIFGGIAVRNIRENLKNYKVCESCKAKIPAWSNTHSCPKNSQGFYTCIDCGDICVRTNSRQCRCSVCQEAHRKDANNKSSKKLHTKRSDERFTSFWRYRFKKTF